MKTFSLVSILSGSAALLWDVGPNFVTSTSGIRMEKEEQVALKGIYEFALDEWDEDCDLPKKEFSEAKKYFERNVIGFSDHPENEELLQKLWDHRAAQKLERKQRYGRILAASTMTDFSEVKKYFKWQVTGFRRDPTNKKLLEDLWEHRKLPKKSQKSIQKVKKQPLRKNFLAPKKVYRPRNKRQKLEKESNEKNFMQW